MKNRFICTLFFVALSTITYSQKSVFTYPFKFKKKVFGLPDYNVSILPNENENITSIAFHDNVKAEYILVNKNFKIIEKFIPDFEETILSEDKEELLGGTSENGVFHFVYDVTFNPLSKRKGGKKAHIVESVDFKSKKIVSKNLYERPKSERSSLIFSDFNQFYEININNENEELVIHKLNSKGEINTHTVKITVPQNGKKKTSLSTYLSNMILVKQDTEIDISQTVAGPKLYSYKDKFVIVVNTEEGLTNVITINTNDFSKDEKNIASQNGKSSGRILLNSFLFQDILYYVALKDKEIFISGFDLPNNKDVFEKVINENNYENILAETPKYQLRRPRKRKDDDIEDFAKLFANLKNQKSGISVTKNSKNQLILLVNTYETIEVVTGGGTWRTGSSANGSYGTGPGQTISTNSVNFSTSFVPSGSSSTSGRYFKSTQFKVMLSSSNFALTKGRVPETVNNQIQDYIESLEHNEMARQFRIGLKEFYGRYDKKADEYLIDELKIIK